MSCHKWAKNCKTTIPRHNIFFDTETWQYPINDTEIVQTFRLGYAIYHRFNDKDRVETREVHYISSQQDFYDYVMSHISLGQKLCIFAHNIAFDLATTSFYYKAFKDGWSSRIPYTKGGTFIDTIKKDNMSIELIDTFNYFKSSLKALGKSLNLPKGDVNFSTKEYIPKRILKLYCLRDVEIIERAIEKFYTFLIDNDLGHSQKTIASQAFGTYRHRFMSTPIVVQANKQPLKLERESYHGGRVECFELGKIKVPKIYKLDINSMYPFVMATEQYPCGYAFSRIGMTIPQLKHKLKQNLITARCCVKTDEAVYATVINHKLVFPVGQFWTVLSTPEIQYAIANNHLLKIKEVEGHKKAPIFKEYIDYMYNKRLQAKKNKDDTDSLFFKYLMNSLYGKTAQKQRITLEKDIEDLMDIKEERILDSDNYPATLIHFGGREIIRTTKEEDSYNSYTAIAAHVTAYARIYLYKLIKQASRENCFYCDTDSIFVNEKGYENLLNLISDYELGLLKVEGITDNLIIHGNKDYVWDKKRTLKGVPASGKLIDLNTYQFYLWTTFHSIFKRGLNTPPKQTLTTKVLKREYNKGICQANGRVNPFSLTI